MKNSITPYKKLHLKQNTLYIPIPRNIKLEDKPRFENEEMPSNKKERKFFSIRPSILPLKDDPGRAANTYKTIRATYDRY